jgi:hypothetical protein
MIPGRIKNKYGLDMPVSAPAIDRSPIGIAYGGILTPYLFQCDLSAI